MAFAHDLISNSTTHLIYHFTENVILFSLVLIGVFALKRFYKSVRLKKLKFK